MKHPALTRVFSVILVILSLTMLVAGVGNAFSAVSDREKGLGEYERLNARVEEYRQVSLALSGRESYQTANDALGEEQSLHEEQASQHRVDLAVYTATRAGILKGTAALQEAEAAFAQGKAMYEAGLKEFEKQEAAFWEGYRQFQEGKRQLEEGQKTLELAQSALAGMRGQLAQGRSLAAILDSEDPEARRELSLAAYDSLLSSLDSATSLYATLKDQGGISAEQMQQLAVLLDQQTDLDLSELLANVTWEGISEESLQELEDRVNASTGMSVGEISEQIRQQRDSIAQLDGEEPISEEQFAALQAAYAQNRAWIEAVDNAMESKISEYEAQLSEAQLQLAAAREQVDAVEPMMEQGKAAIEQARAALDQAGGQMQMGEWGLADGRRQLEEQSAALEEQAESLRQEKRELDADAAKLTEKSAQVEEQRERERRETSLRLMLLEREGIASRVDGGMELLPAAEEYAEALLRQTETQTSGRLRVSVLMIAGAVAACFGIPAAFEKTRIRFWLIAPVVVCLGCAVAAELLCRQLGRGDSYSALSAASFAAIQLLLVLPKKKAAKGS